MFERRLKIILWIMCLAMVALAGRAATIQVVQHDLWSRAAADILTQHQFIETTRGRILDCRGREMAVDVPCMDACVEYPAILEDWDTDDKWLYDRALASMSRRGATFTGATRADRQVMLKAETLRLRGEVDAMWRKLAEVSGQSADQIDEIRRAVIQRVELRRQFVQWQNYQKALGKLKAAPPPWYARWWPAGQPESDGIKLDDYAVDVVEQSQAHVILPAIDTRTYNELARDAENLPGLVLRPGRRRVYPFGTVACHVLGRVAPVTETQLADDSEKRDPLRKYWPTDLVGQQGIEAMCDEQLRGTRGEQITVAGTDEQVTTNNPEPGRDVTLSLDEQLQAKVEKAFAQRRQFYDETGAPAALRENQPGAAVVIDIPTGRVRALVSYPVFDPNQWDADYPALSKDDLTQPLLDRAADAAYEPGSTIKPLMGLAALADGLITPQSTVECTGYLVLNGHRYNVGRCWTVSEYGNLPGVNTSHHQIPTDDPHPTGFLTVTDAIQRSCDVFFETIADRMGMVRQRYWYDRFGLGRPTGIGLAETGGRLPNPDHIPRALIREQTWFAATGQGAVATTPLQMANAVAMIARGGVWMQPTLLENGPAPVPVDLGLPPAGVAAVKLGMERVANTRAGTGVLHHNDPPDPVDLIRVAGKTGTAQASRLTIPVRDAAGHIVIENGHEKRQIVDPNDPAVRTWYIPGGREKTDYDHAWYIGYAPADRPRIAFAVFVEYGGSGGPVAGSIVRDLLAACLQEGYLN